jgi:hypothetical protein
MARRTGPPRKLTDEQILRVLSWHARWQRFCSLHGTQRSLSERLQVKNHLVHRCIERYRRLGAESLSTSVIEPRCGRPKMLKVWQIRAVIAWHLRYKRFLARHGSVKSLAQSLGVSDRTIHSCIARQGAYRQLSQLEATGSAFSRPLVGTSSPTRTRVGGDASSRSLSELLKNWRRVSR